MKSFIVAFLRIFVSSYRKITVINYPCGEGCGEAFVRREYLHEVQILRKKNYNKTVLVICSDADNLAVEERARLLDNEVSSVIHKWDRIKETIMMWIPKRAIETWIIFLNNERVDEKDIIRHNGKPDSCKRQAERFADYCRDTDNLDVNVLPSLIFAKQEYERICRLQMK